MEAIDIMFLMGIDIGTSSTKSAIFDNEGNLIGQAAKDYVFESNHPGFAEQDPVVWWDATIASIRDVLNKSGLKGRDISSIGLSGQMHGMVPLDKNGQVIRKAILHCDLRATNEIEEIKEKFGKEYENIVFNPIFPGFQAISLYWLKKHEPVNYSKIAKVICPKDYVRYRLTGRMGTEHTDASGTLLYDMRNSCWSNKAFSELKIGLNKVPDKIHCSYEVAGSITKQVALQTGLMEGTKVVYGGADQSMQSIGNGIFEPGVIMATIGTSGQVLTVSNNPVFNPKLNTHTFRHVMDKSWYSLGAVLFAGSTLNWFKRNFYDEQFSFEELSKRAELISPGSDGLVFFPCMGGERTPYIDPKTKGMFIGFTMMHTRDHFVRSIMEGVTYAMRNSIEITESLYGKADKLICAGGGVKGKVWAQIQADVYGRKIYISKIKEQACLGAAIMAGIGAGYFKSLKEACTAMCDTNMHSIDPNEENKNIYDTYYKNVYLSLYNNNENTFHRIDDLAKKGEN